MPEVNNVASLRKWFRGCPALSDDNRFRVDYMSDNPTEYALYALPSAIEYRENVLGEFIPKDEQTLEFIFATKEVYGADERQNTENHGFFQNVVDWIIQQNSARNFPDIRGGRVKSIVPTLTAYISQADADSAKYQISIKLKYKMN